MEKKKYETPEMEVVKIKGPIVLFETSTDNGQADNEHEIDGGD